MPLIIPAPRNLANEAFAGLLVGLERGRQEAEERKRQKEAEKAGSSGNLGAGIGTVAGIAGSILLPGAVTPLLLGAGAVIGGGVGRAVGGAFEKTPGARAQAIGQGLTQASQGLIQAAQIEADQKAKEEDKNTAFLQFLTQQGGAVLAQSFQQQSEDLDTRMKGAGLQPLTQSQKRIRFIRDQGSQIAQATARFKQGQLVGEQRARAQAQAEENTFQAFKRAPIDPNTGLPSGFDFLPAEKTKFLSLSEDPQLVETQLAEHRITPEVARVRLAQTEERMRELAKTVRRSAPSPALDLRGLEATVGGRPIEQIPRGGFFNLGGKLFQAAPNPRTGILEANPVDTGQAVQVRKKTLPDGRIVTSEAPFTLPGRPDNELYQIDQNDLTVPIQPPKSAQDIDAREDSEIRARTFKAMIDSNHDDVSGAITKAQEAVELNRQNREADKARQEVKRKYGSLKSGDQVLKTLAVEDAALTSSLAILKASQTQQVPTDKYDIALNIAINRIAKAMRTLPLSDAARSDLERMGLELYTLKR